MNKYEFNATNLIAETFEERGVKFDVVSHHGSEQLLAGFSVGTGPVDVCPAAGKDKAKAPRKIKPANAVSVPGFSQY